MYIDIFQPTDNLLMERKKKGYQRMTCHVENFSDVASLEWSGRSAWWQDIDFFTFMRGPQERNEDGVLMVDLSSISSLKSLKMTAGYDKNIPKHDLEMALLRGGAHNRSYMSDYYFIVGKSRHLTPYPKNLCLVGLVSWEEERATMMQHGIVVDLSKGVEQLGQISMTRDWSFFNSGDSYQARFLSELTPTTLHFGQTPSWLKQGVWTSDHQYFPMS